MRNISKLILAPLVLILSSYCVVAKAAPFVVGKKYRIESNFDKNNYQRSGAIGLGTSHGATSNTYYVADGNFTADCWWYIEEVGNGVYTIKNASTNKYLTMQRRYYDCLLNDAVSAESKWRIKFDGAALLIYVNSSEPQYLGFDKTSKTPNPSDLSLSTDRKEATTPYRYFNIYDESGKLVNPLDVPDLEYAGSATSIPQPSSDIKKYATNIKINDKNIAYASDKKFWLSTMPMGEISITFEPVASDVTITLQDNAAAVTSADKVQCGKLYQLVTAVNGKNVVTSNIYFTTMPVLDIRHEGSLACGMSDYVWGEFCLSAKDVAQSVSLNARFRSRGATASKSEKHAMNMKIRELATDAEVDTMLLGLRSASSWILDAAAIDYTKMRNRVCFDIWNEFSKVPYETKFDSRNGIVGKFVEVIENGTYRGIYTLNDRINRKLLGLKKPVEETATARGVCYKANELMKFDTFEKPKFLSYYGDTRNYGNIFCGWELKEPEDYPSVATWAPLADLFDYPGNVSYYKSRFHWDNMIDYHLFIVAFLIIDNGNKNEFLSAKNITSADANDTKLFFTPWDLDTALGGDANAVNKDGSYNETSAKRISEENINQCYPFKAMLTDAAYRQQLLERWKQARQNEFSLFNVTKKMLDYARLFVANGAYEREKNAKGTKTVEDIMKEVEYIGKWYANQINAVDDWFGIEHVNQTSAIDAVTQIAPIDNQQLYDLFGRKIATPSNGVYIKGGKKYVAH